MLMMVMTSHCKWAKIHTPNDATLREPGALRGGAHIVDTLNPPAHGVDLT
jgi:hypothetical protein